MKKGVRKVSQPFRAIDKLAPMLAGIEPAGPGGRSGRTHVGSPALPLRRKQAAGAAANTTVVVAAVIPAATPILAVNRSSTPR
jgi:hypothetical protein